MKFILARKVNMTQVWTDDGKVVPVTVLRAERNKVNQIKTVDKDGYHAVAVSMGKSRREFRMQNAEFRMGQEIGVSVFEPGDVINLSGVSKGRGTAGPMKRHGFHGAPASHGHDHPRAVGSIGHRFPQHVRPGKRMAGRMGASLATVKHSLVVAVDPEQNLLLVKGGVPGAPNSLIKVMTTGQKKQMPKLAEYNQMQNVKIKDDTAVSS